MLASSVFSSEIVVGVAYTVGAAFVIFVGRAAMQTLSKRQTTIRDRDSTYERLYGKPANPRTGEPATTGWTHHVDSTLNELTAVQKDVKNSVDSLHTEVKGLAGRIITKVDDAAKAAATEVIHQAEERERVQRRDSDQ